MRETFPVCCASTIRTQPVSNKSMADTTHFRLWIFDFRLAETEITTNSKCVVHRFFLDFLHLKSAI